MCKAINYTKYQKRVIKLLSDLLGIQTPFTYERAKNNHLKVLIDGVAKPMYTGSTPSDCKSINNFMADVKREVKASKLETVETLKPAKANLINLIKQSNDKLIQGSVKSLRTRIPTLKTQEETLVLESRNLEGINTKRLEIVKHSLKHILQSRKQGAYIKAKEMADIENTVMTHLNFMLPTMAYYAELLNNKNKYQVKQEEQVNKLTSVEEKVVINSAEQPNKKEIKELINVNESLIKKKIPEKIVNEVATINKNSDSATELMAMSPNNRVSLLRNLTKAQALTLINDIHHAMAQNREEDIEAVVNLIRDKELPLEAIISRMEAA